MKTLHAPEHKKRHGSIESWYCETGGDDPRNYGACKGALLNLLVKLDCRDINIDEIRPIEGIYIWNVTYVVDMDESGLDSDQYYVFVNLITEHGDQFYHYVA